MHVHVHTHAHTHTRTHARTHERTNARTHTHTHRLIYHAILRYDVPRTCVRLDCAVVVQAERKHAHGH